MKLNIIYLLLIALFGVIVSASIAQQNQNVPKTDTEVEKLKIQLQTAENEKIELETKLAEANARLINTEFEKLKLELKESNQKWLIGWIIFFLTVLAVVGTPLWLLLKSGVNRIITNLKSNTDQLISDEVERSLTGFKEAVDQVNTQKNQIRVLQKESAISILENFMRFSYDESYYPEQLDALPDSALLDVFSDEKRYLVLRCKAAEILTYKKSTRLVFPMLEFLNSVVDSDLYNETDVQTERILRSFVSFLGEIHTEETYEGLKKFFNRLLTENPKHKGLFLTWTVFSLAYVSRGLKRGDSASMIRRAVPDLHMFLHEEQALKNLAAYFDRFNEPEGIKEILAHHAADKIPELEDKCLELLQKHDPKFVEKWKAEKEAADPENEESS